MIGVVLWSDNDAGKAVFWCEDQGDLAYYEEPTLDHQRACFFDTGDMVQFDISVHRRLRIAGNPRVLQEKVGDALPEALRREMGGKLSAVEDVQEDAGPETAQIIHFTPRATAPRFLSSMRKA